jgi:hypothetical protein
MDARELTTLIEGTRKDQALRDCLWFLAFATCSSIWCVTAAQQLGASFDEPVYLVRGLEHWRTGSASGLLRMGTMPLPADLDTLPLYLWERWHGVPIDPLRDWEKVIPWARAGTLFFWWLLLFYALRTGRMLGGPWGGRLAVALLACEPSLLAHASLATTDIAVSACILALVYHFRTGREARWMRRVGWPTFWFGAAVLAKASGLIYGGIALTVMEFERLGRQGVLKKEFSASWWQHARQIWSQTKPVRRDLVQIVSGGLALTFLYCGCDWRPEPSFVAWAHALPAGGKKQAAVWFAEHFRVFSNAGEGIIRQVKHNMHGHGVYLLGITDPRDLWYYFPVLLTIKLSAPFLLAPFVLLVLRPRSLANWACLTAGVLILFSLTWHVQIGIRLVLPLVVLGGVGIAGGLVQAWQTDSAVAIAEPARTWTLRQRLVAGGCGTGVLWTAAAALSVWPHGLCYVNEFWGGTRQGYLRVSDGNYDWGQGLPDLVRWQQQHGKIVNVWYFGTDPTLGRLPLGVMPLHLLPVRKPDDLLPYVRGKLLAVSTTLRYGSMSMTEAHRQALALLATRRPVARTMTFLIYDFKHEAPDHDAVDPCSVANPASTFNLRDGAH